MERFRSGVRRWTWAAWTRRGSRPGEDAGFTLVEILVVITILGILAGILAPRVVGVRDRALQTEAYVQIQRFGQALEIYAIDVGDYPTTEDGLEALAVAPGNVDAWAGPYEPGLIDSDGETKPDPWGNPYVYEYPGQHTELGYPYDIISYGRDGREGGSTRYDVDISNWDGIGTLEQ